MLSRRVKRIREGTLMGGHSLTSVETLYVYDGMSASLNSSIISQSCSKDCQIMFLLMRIGVEKFSELPCDRVW